MEKRAIIISIFILLFFISISTVSATWWNSSFEYKEKITLNGESNPSQGSIQINITYNPHMEVNFSDLRFTDSSEINELTYWVQQKNASDYATIWVKIPSPNQSSIFMYYGNPLATSKSNGYNTFLLFDDFNSNSVNTTKWQNGSAQGNGDQTMDNGILTMNSPPTDDYAIFSTNKFDPNVEARALVKFRTDNIGNDIGYFGFVELPCLNPTRVGCAKNLSAIRYNVASAIPKGLFSILDTAENVTEFLPLERNVWQRWSIAWNRTILSANINNTNTTIKTGQFLNSPMNLTVSAGAGSAIDIDWIFVRNMSSSLLDPTTSFGNELNFSSSYLSIDFYLPTPLNNSHQSSNSIIFNFSGNSGGTIDTGKIFFNNTNYVATCSGSTIYTCNYTLSNIADGNYSYYGFINSTSGTSNTTSTRFITIDTIPPSISISYPLNNTNFSSSTININFTATDTNLNSCWTNTNNGANTTRACTSGVISNFSDTYSEGLNTVNIFTNDTFGNQNQTQITFRVDTTKPSILIDYPQNTTYKDIYAYSYSFNSTITDSGAGIDKQWYSLNGGANTIFTGNTTLSSLIAGSNTLRVYANDTLNNIKNVNVTFYLAFTPKINDINISNSSTSYDRNTDITNLTSGLVGYWKFDQNNSIQIDSSGNGNNGTAGSASFNPSGKIGGAYYFASSSMQTTPNILNITNNNFAFSAWINMLSAPTLNTAGIIDRYQESTGTSTYGVRLGIATSQRVIFDVGNGTGTQSSSKQEIVSSIIPNLNQWYFVVGSYNGTSLTLCLDGNCESNILTLSNGLKNWENANNWTIGYTHHSNGGFNGSLDEVRIYNRSLSASEINSLYSITNPTFQEYANTTITATITDEDTSNSNLWYSWAVDGVQSLAGYAQNIFNWIFNKPNQQVTLIVNDTNNYTVSQSWNISTTFINPQIAFASPTLSDYSNSSKNYVSIGLSVTEANFANITFNLFNSSNYLLNSTVKTVSTTSFNFSNLADGNYKYNVSITDLVGNTNQTETRNIFLDATPPTTTASATSPAGVTAYTFGNWANTSVRITLASFDGGIGFTNTLFPIYCIDTSNTCSPTTVIGTGVTDSTEGTSYIRYYANDTLNNSETIKSQVIKIDSILPIPQFVSPTQNTGVNLSQNYVLANISLTETNFANITFNLYNNTGLVNSSFYSTLVNSVNWSNLIDNKYYYNVTIVDLASNKNSTETRIITLDRTAPTAVLNTPINNTYSNSASNNFTSNATDNLSGIKNYTLTITNSSGIVNQTSGTLTGQLSQTVGIVVNLIDGIYKWFYNFFDFSGNSITTNNNTLTVDTTSPVLSFVSPTLSTGSNVSNNFILANISLTETNFANITFNLYNSTGLVNSSVYSTAITYVNWSNLADEDYVYNVTAVDLVGLNTTITNLIRLDVSSPSGALLSPNNNSYLNQSYVFNVNASDNLGIKNITLSLYNSSTTFTNTSLITNSTTLFQSISLSFNSISDGIYSWFESVFDWASNSFTSVTRTITFDSTLPSISFNPSTLANNSWQTTNSILINASITDTNFNSTNLVFEGVTQSFSNNIGNDYWVYNVVSNTNSYSYYVVATDLAGNRKTSSNNIINVDLQNPTISINNPISQAYNYNTSLILNISASHPYLDSCWYNFDNGINNSITCNSQILFDINESSHVVNAFVNSSSGRTTTTSTNFLVSLTPPSTSIKHPLNSSWLNYNNINFNYTVNSSNIVDNCSFWIDSSGVFSVNQTANSPTQNIINTFNLNLLDGNYLFNIQCTDDASNIAFGSPFYNLSFSVDTLNPKIVFSGSTPVNNLNTTSTSFTVDVTASDTNEANITFNLYNNLGLYNSTTFTDSRRTITYSLPNNIYYYNVSIVDKASNKNNTITNQIMIDNSAPSISISFPIEGQNYANNNSMDLNYTVSDSLAGIKDCSYTIFNSTGSLISSPYLASCQNTTFSLPENDIDYTLTLFAEDNLNNIASSAINFGIRTNSPAIALDNPTNNQFINRLNNITFNFTATRNIGIDTCNFYNNFTGTWGLNSTITGITSGVNKNIGTFNNFSETSYSWYVSCNDTLGNQGFSTNSTFTLDITNPVIDIPVGAVSLTQGDYNVYFTSYVTESNLDYCRFSIYNNSGAIEGLYNNLLYTCNETQHIVVSAFSTYNITSTAYDKAGNGGLFTRSFTTSASTPTVGGGGGGTPPANNIPVIGLNDINGTKKYSNLEREAIYAGINNYCSEKLRKGTLAVVDYSVECSLNTDDLNKLSESLKSKSIIVVSSDLAKFYIGYKNNDLFQGQEVQSVIDTYGLFTAKLGILNLLQLTPPSVDTLVLIKTSESNYTISYTVFSNKPLKSCEVISSNEDISCEVTNTTVKIKYLIKNTDFLSDIFSGVISVTTDASSDDVEQKKIQFNFRVYNMGYEPIKGVPILIILALLVIVIPVSGTYFYRKRGRKRSLNNIFSS